MSSTSTPVESLADELVAFQDAHMHEMALYKGELTHIERWPDYTPAGRVERLAALTDLGDRARATPTDQTSERSLADAVAFVADSAAVNPMIGSDFLTYGPELFAVNPEIGMVPAMLTFLPRYPLVTAEHGAGYHERVSAFPAFVDSWCERLRDGAAAGVVPIRHLVQRQIDLIDRTLAAPLSRGPLGTQAPPTELDEAAGAAWTADLHRLLDDSLTVGLVTLRRTLNEHTLPAALPDDRPGLMHLPGGGDYYTGMLWASTSLRLTPEQIHQTGLERIEELRQEYEAIGGPTLGTDDLGEIYRHLRDDPALRYQDAETIVVDATAALARANEAARSWFGQLPQAACTAHAVEQGGIAFYQPPTKDGGRAGEFFFNTADPTNWGTYQIEAVTFHESIPGHHLQLALAQELPDLHPLLAGELFVAYSEGWGLYAERLADEMELYSSDLGRLGMLATESMRACRLVVDTGLHAMGWSRDQAIDYMLANTPLARGQVEGEIDRYIGMAGQACSYLLGRMAIDEMRASAEQRLGSGFQLPSFHDAVLGGGALPLDALRQSINAWTETQAATG